MHRPQTNLRSTLLLLLLMTITISLSAQGELTAMDHYQLARESYQNSPDDALIHAQNAMDRALEEEDLLTMGKAHFLLGYIYDHKDDVANAFHFYFGGISVYEQLGNANRVQQLYENLAYIAERKGVHVIAEQLRYDRMKSASEVGYQIHSDVNYDRGLSLKHQGEIEEALKAFLLALKLLETNPNLSDTTMYGNIWLELGVINRMQATESGEQAFLDSALLCYDRAEHFNGGDAIHLSKVQNNKGNVLRIQGQFELAKRHFYESIRLSRNFKKRKISPYFNLGRVYFSENKMDSAIWAFTRSLEINISDLNYQELQDLQQRNIELSKAPELFGAVQYLDSLGIKDPEIRGRAMRHVYRMARERYEIINASNNSMIAQLYEKHRQELAEEEQWSLLKTLSLSVMLVVAVCVAAWFWWKRYSVRRHNRRLAIQMEKRLKDKYGIELKE